MNNVWITPVTFLLFTGAVALLTYLITRRDERRTNEGYFLAGRSLTYPFIAASLLLTNLSTEQMVGLNGDAFSYGLSVMAWEVVAVVALVAMALFFLPRFLKSGIATVPQYLELRFDKHTGSIANLIFLLAYMLILLPIVLYTGSKGLLSIFGVQSLFGITSELGMLYLIVILIGVVGSVYALCGGLRTLAVADLLNGIGLLIGGFMIVYFALRYAGAGEGMFAGLERCAPTSRRCSTASAETIRRFPSPRSSPECSSSTSSTGAPTSRSSSAPSARVRSPRGRRGCC